MEAKKKACCGFNEIIPFEMLVKIFSYLPLSHLKKARLVCSQWYEASKDETILKKQNFVFTSDLRRYLGQHQQLDREMQEMFITLAKGDFSYYNLKFIEAKLSNAFEQFVSSHGANIYSLSFQSCIVSFKVIETIMIHCINLKELNFNHDKESDYYDNNHLQAPTDLQIPVVNGREIIRGNLTTLKLVFNESVSKDLLLFFINVYPSVKRLHLSSEYYDSGIIGKCYQIPEFCLQFRFSKLTHIVCKKLFPDENLSTVWNKLLYERESYVRISSLKMHYGSITELNDLEVKFENLPFIFQNFPNLEHLKVRSISYGDVITGVSNVLKLIADSRLKSLALHFRNNCTEETINDILWINQSMERFSIRALSFCQSNMVVHMLKMFPNLTSLHLAAEFKSEIIKQDVTSYIFKHLVKLKSLSLYLPVDSKGLLGMNAVDDSSSFKKNLVKLKYLSLYPFANTRSKGLFGMNAICNFLPNLEHLTLCECKSLSEKCIEKFVNFPNLKYLDLQGCNDIKENGIVKLTKILPYLEWLNIYDIPISNDTLFQICDNLKYLRRLEVEILPSEETRTEVFRRCSTLRYLKTAEKKVWYTYDYYQKTISRQRPPCPCSNVGTYVHC